jgi:hypothetical protein
MTFFNILSFLKHIQYQTAHLEKPVTNLDHRSTQALERSLREKFREESLVKFMLRRGRERATMGTLSPQVYGDEPIQGDKEERVEGSETPLFSLLFTPLHSHLIAFLEGNTDSSCCTPGATLGVIGGWIWVKGGERNSGQRETDGSLIFSFPLSQTDSRNHFVQKGQLNWK